MRHAELVRQLRRLGVEYRRPSKGSHEIWWRPDRKLYTLIPNHAGRDIAAGTLAKILKDLDLTQDDLRRV